MKNSSASSALFWATAGNFSPKLSARTLWVRVEHVLRRVRNRWPWCLAGGCMIARRRGRCRLVLTQTIGQCDGGTDCSTPLQRLRSLFWRLNAAQLGPDLKLQPALVCARHLTRNGHVEAQRYARRGQVGYPSTLAVRKNRGCLVSLLPPPHERLGNDSRTKRVALRQRRRLKRFPHDSES